MSMTTARRGNRLNLRATEHQDDLIKTAAQLRGESVSEFILQSACARAEQELADRHHFVIPAERMATFVEMLDRPAKENPRLRRLLAEPSVLER